MAATSRVTAQNQVSIPAEIRRLLSIVPGTELVWEEKDGVIVVRPKRFSLEDVRKACAARGIAQLSLASIRDARDRAVARKHGRR